MTSKRVGVFAVALLALTTGGCSDRTMFAGAAAQTSAPSPFIITATIKELMDSTVDPAADALWDSVSSSSSAAGFVERRPLTEEDWKEVRRHAITLVEVTNLIVMTGRHSAPHGTQPGPGELTPEQIDQRITATRPAFVELAHGLRTTAMTALAAIDRRDAGALFDVGGNIDEACEACHVGYWYPNQASAATDTKNQ